MQHWTADSVKNTQEHMQSGTQYCKWGGKMTRDSRKTSLKISEENNKGVR